MADSDQKEKAKVLLAGRLKELQAADFLSFGDIVHHLRRGNSLAPCIVKLAKHVSPDGFDKIYGDLFKRMTRVDTQEVVLHTWKKALLNEVALVEEILLNIPDDEIPRLFKFWLTETRERATWEQLVNSSPYAVLRACAAEGDKRADDAAAEDGAEVIEEVMEVDDAEPPAEGQPTDK
jgi:hypothetical protein